MSISKEESSRVTTHMNRDHSDALLHYLEHYGGIKNAKSAQISQFTSAGMTIEYSTSSGAAKKSWTYKFEPPLEAGQPRKKMEDMHHEAKRALGYSDVVVNAFALDRSAWFQMIAQLVCEVLVLTAPTDKLVERMPALANKLVAPALARAGIATTLANVGVALKATLLGVWFGAHALEVVFCLLPIMKRHGTTDATVRLQYAIATFIGGFPVWTYFKRQEREARKQQ